MLRSSRFPANNACWLSFSSGRLVVSEMLRRWEFDDDLKLASLPRSALRRAHTEFARGGFVEEQQPTISTTPIAWHDAEGTVTRRAQTLTWPRLFASDDGEVVAAWSHGNGAEILRGARVERTLSGTSGEAQLWAVAVSVDGALTAALYAGWTGAWVLVFRDANAPGERRGVSKAVGSPIGLAFTREGNLLVFGTESIHTIDVSGAPVATVPVLVSSWALNAQRDRVAVITGDNALVLLELTGAGVLTERAQLEAVPRATTLRWQPATKTLHVHRHVSSALERWTAQGMKAGKGDVGISAMEVRPGTNDVLLCTGTRAAKLLGDEPARFKAHSGGYYGAAFHPTKPLVAMGAAIFDLAGNQLHVGPGTPIAAIGEQLLTSRDEELLLMDWSGDVLKRSNAGHAWHFSVSDRGSFVAAFGHDGGHLRYFDSFDAAPRELEGHHATISKSGAHLAITDVGLLRVVTVAGEEKARTDEVISTVVQSAWFLSEDIIGFVTVHGSARLWDFKSGAWVDLLRDGKEWLAFDSSDAFEGSKKLAATLVRFDEKGRRVQEAGAPTVGLLARWLARL